MKGLKRMLIFCFAAAVLFAFTFSAAAILFDAEAVYESVFVIYSGNAIGSGFAVGENCIISNAHVISDPSEVVVRTYGGEAYAAIIIGMDERRDIAVLGVEGVTLQYLKLADQDELRVGDDVFAVGAPKSMAYTLTKGILSAKDRMIGSDSYFQLDAAINEGNSGGPLLNERGEVLGVNTMKLADSEGIGLAIPMETVCEYLRELELPLDAAGNVAGHIEKSAEEPNVSLPAHTEASAPEEAPRTVTKNSPLLYIALGVAACSIILNIVLVCLLSHEKRKNLKFVQDPRERTDFEIDLLE